MAKAKRKDEIYNSEGNRYISKTCSNVATDEINITEDKLRNIISEYKIIEKKGNRWQVPLSYAITFAVTFITTKEYGKVFGYDAKTIIVLFLLIAVIFTIRGGICLLCVYKQVGVEKLIKTIKNENDFRSISKKKKKKNNSLILWLHKIISKVDVTISRISLK